MKLRFPFFAEPIVGPAPPSLPIGAQERWRPLVPITIYSPAGTSAFFPRALMDTGADDTIFPLDIAMFLGLPLLAPTGHAMRWRGQRIALRFGEVQLELTDFAGGAIRWDATVAFSVANMRYPLLGLGGCLEFLDARFLGRDQVIEVEPIASLPAPP